MAEAETKNKSKHRMAILNEMRGDMPLEVVREGVTFPWMVSERALQTLKDYEIRDDDVWITSYPKAGTHWTVEITNLILANGEEEKVDRKRQPSPIEFDFAQPGLTFPPEFPPHLREPLYEQCKSWPSPRVFMTHLPEHLMPKQIHKGKGKVIFVIRNPKDLAVSKWHFLRPGKANPEHEQWDTFIDLFCTEEVRYGGWFTYILSFWKKHRHDENFLFLKYEDMKRDLRGAVVQMAEFLERPLSDEAIERIVKLSIIDSMKQRYNTADDKSGKAKMGAPGAIRKGIVGDWKTQFTVAHNESFDKLFRNSMEESDLHIDFEDNKYFSTATIRTS